MSQGFELVIKSAGIKTPLVEKIKKSANYTFYCEVTVCVDQSINAKGVYEPSVDMGLVSDQTSDPFKYMLIVTSFGPEYTEPG